MSGETRHFTQDAERILELAQKEAGRRAIEPRHLLLALVHEPEGTVGDLLRGLGLDATQVEALARKTGRRWSSSTTETASTVSPQPLVILDENGEVLVANQSAQDVIDNHMEELLEALSQNAGDTTEVPIGNRTYLAIPGRLSDARTIVILRDITEAKGRESAVMSYFWALRHDLKMPLQIIISYSDFLVDTGGQPNDAEFVSEAHEIIRQRARSMNDMIDLLGLPLRGEDVSPHTWRQPCDLTELSEKVVAQLQREAGDSIHSDLYPGRCQVLGVRSQLESMLFILVGNFVIPQPGDQQPVKVILSRDTGAIQLRIQQRGRLVSKDDLSNIFRKYNLDWGMGLSTVKAIVEAHGGTVEAAGLPEGGMEVVVRLPAYQEA